MEVLLGCAAIIALSLVLLVCVLIARNRTSKQPVPAPAAPPRAALESELAEVNRALDKLAAGEYFALVKAPDGRIASFTREHFGSLLAKRCQLTVQLQSGGTPQ